MLISAVGMAKCHRNNMTNMVDVSIPSVFPSELGLMRRPQLFKIHKTHMDRKTQDTRQLEIQITAGKGSPHLQVLTGIVMLAAADYIDRVSLPSILLYDFMNTLWPTRTSVDVTSSLVSTKHDPECGQRSSYVNYPSFQDAVDANILVLESCWKHTFLSLFLGHGLSSSTLLVSTLNTLQGHTSLRTLVSIPSRTLHGPHTGEGCCHFGYA